MKNTTRRKVVTAGGTAVILPAFASVVSGETSSGNVEVTTTTTQPAGTNVEIRLYEDTTGDGTADGQQLESINTGSGVVTEYTALDAKEASGNTLWADVILTSSDGENTPEVSSMTITLPDEQQEGSEPTPVESDPQGLDSIIDNYLFFVAAVVTVVAGVGITSKSLAVGAIAAYTTFALIAIETGTQLLQNILIVTLVLVFIGFGFKFWRLEGVGE